MMVMFAGMPAGLAASMTERILVPKMPLSTARASRSSRSGMGFIIRTACALYLQVKAVLKQTRQALCQLFCTGIVATHQRLAYRPSLCARQRNQPRAQLLQPSPCAHRQVFDDVFRPRPGEQL